MISHNPTSGYFRHVLVRFAKQYQHLAKIHLDWRLLLGSQERLHTGNEQKAFLGSGRSGYGSFFLDTHFYIYMLYIHVCTCLKYTYIQSIYIIDIHTYMCAGWWCQHLWQNISQLGILLLFPIYGKIKNVANQTLINVRLTPYKPTSVGSGTS
jgi:hypothetical protein